MNFYFIGIYFLYLSFFKEVIVLLDGFEGLIFFIVFFIMQQCFIILNLFFLVIVMFFLLRKQVVNLRVFILFFFVSFFFFEIMKLWSIFLKFLLWQLGCIFNFFIQLIFLGRRVSFVVLIIFFLSLRMQKFLFLIYLLKMCVR